MASKLNISRRDFINGFAMSVAAGSALSPLELFAQQTGSVSAGALTGSAWQSHRDHLKFHTRCPGVVRPGRRQIT